MDLSALILLMPLPPLAGAALLRLFGARMGRRAAGMAACAAVAASLAAATAAVWGLAQLQPAARLVSAEAFRWAALPGADLKVSLLLDPLSAVMVLVVTGVGLLIHIYSTGYMHGEEPAEYARFFACLNFFIFSMLTLVLAANFLVLFAGWELVGLSSYLLIGFYRSKTSAADAGKKAFIVNRVGDLGFTLAVLLVLSLFGTLDFAQVFPRAAQVVGAGTPLAMALALLLFMGAVGKSAQVPLHVWLPDAMEGPTPVSALIHAATMVTAGVFMVARCHALFSLSPQAMAVVAWTGAGTALFAATIALAQYDIKRVMAYSTLSQLGYMMLGVGVGAYTAGFFHLFTHAFFKALLFLACGSVMHALGGELDMARMGGLRKRMPVTFWAFTIGALCLVGFPLTSGFFSKDEILWEAFSSPQGSRALWLVGTVTSLLTALYVGRTLFKVFFGRPRDAELHAHAHESPASMTVPLVVLAALALAAGLLNLPHGFLPHQLFHEWLTPVFADLGPHPAHAEQAAAQGAGGVLALRMMGLYSAFAVLGLAFTAWLFVRREGLADRWYRNPAVRAVHTLLRRKYYIDEIYQAALVDAPLFACRLVWRWFDQGIVDGAVNLSAFAAQAAGAALRVLQNGKVRTYLAVMALGAALLLALAMRLI